MRDLKNKHVKHGGKKVQMFNMTSETGTLSKTDRVW